MPQQCWCLQDTFHFFPTQYNWQLLLLPDRRQFYPLVFHPIHPICKSQSVHCKLKVAVRRRLVLLLHQVQIVVYLIGVQFCGQLVVVERHLCKATRVVVQRTLASSCKRRLLLHILIQLLKARNVCTGLLNQILFFITWILINE